MNAPRLLALSLLLAHLPAQTTPCLSLNDATNLASPNLTLTSLSGYTVQGWQFIPSSATIAQSVQLYTGNTQITSVRHMIIEIWSENPTNNLPGTRIAGGTWRISNALGRTWQGANLDSLVVLQASTPYWLVWHEPGSSMVPTDTSATPVAVPAAARSASTTGVWATRPASALKFRIFCSQLDQQGVVPYGTPCTASTGRVGTTFTNQPPTVGNANFVYEGTGFTGGALAVIVLGIKPGWVSAPVPGLPAGCLQHTDILVSTFGTVSGPTTAGPSAIGYVQFPVGIPNNMALMGVFVAGQIAGFDAGATAPLQFSTGNALRVTVY
jgi:hypothetical protein